jgi:hypothetical protein
MVLVMEEISVLNSGIYAAQVHVKYELTTRNFLVTREQMFCKLNKSRKCVWQLPEKW